MGTPWMEECEVTAEAHQSGLNEIHLFGHLWSTAEHLQKLPCRALGKHHSCR